MRQLQHCILPTFWTKKLPSSFRVRDIEWNKLKLSHSNEKWVHWLISFKRVELLSQLLALAIGLNLNLRILFPYFYRSLPYFYLLSEFISASRPAQDPKQFITMHLCDKEYTIALLKSFQEALCFIIITFNASWD